MEPEAELWVKLEYEVHEALMSEPKDMDTSIEKEDFDDIIDRFKKKNKPAYNFLTKAGPKYKTSVYKLCKRLIEEEEFPTTFSETVLKQLWKKKGSREDLNNHRYIHLKDWKPRLTETIITNMMKEDILIAGTKYQIGGVPGHRIEEHLIVLKSFIQQRTELKK